MRGYEERRQVNATSDPDTAATVPVPVAGANPPLPPPRFPESIPITLPSTLGFDEVRKLGHEALIELEVKLRIGQCNDHLHKCRLNIAHKSFLYRTGKRQADSQRESGRSWAEMHTVEGQLAHNARCYRSGRQGLVRLQATDHLNKYKSLERVDLKANAAVVDPNVRGQRDKDLPWIWTVDLEGRDEDPEWLNESTCYICSPLAGYVC